PALGESAPEARAMEPELVAKHVQQRRVLIRPHRVPHPVDVDRDSRHSCSLRPLVVQQPGRAAVHPFVCKSALAAAYAACGGTRRSYEAIRENESAIALCLLCGQRTTKHVANAYSPDTCNDKTVKVCGDYGYEFFHHPRRIRWWPLLLTERTTGGTRGAGS